MPIYAIPKEFFFPPASDAEPNGLLGYGGDLHPTRLLIAYQCGIFPWYSEGQPILWFSPNPRFVLDPTEFHVPRSLKQTIRKQKFRITMDLAFEEVIEHCSEKKREGQRT